MLPPKSQLEIFIFIFIFGTNERRFIAEKSSPALIEENSRAQEQESSVGDLARMNGCLDGRPKEIPKLCRVPATRFTQQLAIAIH
jgi:hypothetical protein